MSRTTLLFDCGQANVKARLWSAFYANGETTPTWEAAGIWDERVSLPDDPHTIGFQQCPEGRSVVFFRKHGYQDLTFETVMPDDGIKIVRLEPTEPTRLHTQDKYFYTADGQRHTLIGSTELLLAHKYDTQGPSAIEPILAERQNIGFNNLRVLWQKDIRNQNQPWLMPLAKMPDFLAKCAVYGFHIQGCILADCQVVNPSEVIQQQRVSDVRHVTMGFDNLIEQLGNEWKKNGHDPHHFSKPTDRLSCSSSGTDFGADDFHASDVWDFFTFSGDRNPPQKAIREYGPMEVAYDLNKPAICDEGMVPGENSSDTKDFERAGAQARSASKAGRYHHRAGSNRDAGDANLSRLFTPFERECAIAFVSGLKGSAV